MLKHREIIEALSESDKLSLLTDIKMLEGEQQRELGVHRISYEYLKNRLRDSYPRASSLAHSWDTRLISEVAKDTAAELISEGNNLVITPGPKIKFTPFRQEITEDPKLAEAIAAAYAIGTRSAGCAAALSGYYIAEEDAELMDSRPSDRILNEFAISPFRRCASLSGAVGAVTDSRIPNELYRNANQTLQNAVVREGIFGKDVYAITECATAEDTVSFIRGGGICLSGSLTALTAALNKYKKIKKQVEAGEKTTVELDEECKAGKAISPEEIDVAVDRLLSLSDSVNREKKTDKSSSSNRNRLSLLATESSAVLLKNDSDVLPIRKIKHAAIIGDIAATSTALGKSLSEKFKALIEHSFGVYVGYARGYDMSSSHENSALTREAVMLCARSERVFLFLGHGYEGSKRIAKSTKSSLPSSQLALLERLRQFGHKITVILESGYSTDVGFARHFSSMITAPFGLRYDARAIFNIVTGKTNPSGRLSYTLYSSSDAMATRHRVLREKFGRKTGPFIGYRKYSSEGVFEDYPFGFGLSYSKVSYSKPTLVGKCVRITLTNRSGRPVDEVVEIYLSNLSSNIIRPALELSGFAKLHVPAHKSVTADIELKIPESFNCDREGFTKESGTYRIYVGSSSRDIHGELSVSVRGGNIPKDGAVRADYLESESNILTDNFTLEANYSLMNKTLKNVLCGIGALLIGLALGIYNIANPSGAFIGITSAVMVIAGLLFFALEMYEKNKAYKEEREIIEEANRRHFDNAESLTEFSTASMFRDEFDVTEDEDVEDELHDQSDEDDVLIHINKALDLPRLEEQLARFSAEYGVVVSEDSLKMLIAAMCSSRLVVFRGLDSGAFHSLSAMISEYFGSHSYYDILTEAPKSEDALLFGSNVSGYRTKRSTAHAIEAACTSPQTVHIAALDGVRSESVTAYLNTFVRHAANPTSRTSLVAHNEWDKEITLTLTPNLWFFINLAEDECYDAIPLNITETAAVISLTASLSEPLSDHTPTDRYTLAQLDFLTERSSEAYRIPEAHWKKIDKLEANISTVGEFRLTNKLTLALERFFAAYRALGAENNEAVDAAMSAKLIPRVVTALGNIASDDETSLSDTIAAIFGEDALPLCQAVAKDAEINRESDRLARLAEAATDTIETENVSTDNKIEPSQEASPSSDTAESESAPAPIVENTEDLPAPMLAEESEVIVEEFTTVTEEPSPTPGNSATSFSERLRAMSYAEVRRLAADSGIPAGGKKEEIIQRLLLATDNMSNVSGSIASVEATEETTEENA